MGEPESPADTVGNSRGLRERRAEILAVAAVALVAAVLRYAAISARGGHLNWDETMFLQMGRNLLAGRGYQFNGLSNITFPALPALIAAPIWILTGSASFAFNLPAALFGGLTVIPVYLLAKKIFSRSAGLAAAMIFAGFRPLLYFTPFCSYRERLYSGSEPLFLFLTAWVLYLFWKAWRDKSLRCAALAGLVCGVSFIARQEALILCGALAAWLFAASLLWEKRLSANLAARALLAVALFAAASAPWFIYGRIVTGHFLLGPHLSHNMVIREAFKSVYFENNWKPFFRIHHALNEENTEFESPYYGVAPYHLEKYRSYSSGSTFSNLFKGLDPASLRLWARDMRFLVPSYILLLVLLGLPADSWRKFLIRAGFLAASLVPAVTIALTLLVIPRYNIYTMAALAVFAAGGISLLCRFACKYVRISAFWPTVVAAAVIAAVGATEALRFNYTRRSWPHPEHHIERLMPLLADQLRAIDPEPTRLLSHNPQIPFAAGDIWIPLPTDGIEDVAQFARSKNAALMVLRKGDAGLREFGLNKALERRDLFEPLVVGEFDNERIGILRVLPSPSAPSGESTE
ncbi:MAG: ArnT family glycosyltransferase [Planctomycetota bacterium]|jgi:4-amino-4-deoxy-L-arabinose transferase-like glycosyltransferase